MTHRPRFWHRHHSASADVPSVEAGFGLRRQPHAASGELAGFEVVGVARLAARARWEGAERVSVADRRLVLVRRIERRRRVDSIGDDGLLRGRASITHCVVERTLDFESLTVQFSGTVGNARHPPARALRYAYVTIITSNVTITITLRSETRDYGNGNGSGGDVEHERELVLRAA